MPRIHFNEADDVYELIDDNGALLGSYRHFLDALDERNRLEGEMDLSRRDCLREEAE